ncbi:hypothetical protein M413DRAFT_447385 [Hebeloma cylindrosporum]|uniref:F-box domain-containing protein n=1 Tax=Hebeloma cylindrosporum TaxID=76867 RepID=A0A0C3BQT8_HEBCY|nr:hypothetical protein M413DRAFT_447385 [Hebeloma cylindrosporum h7]
MSFCQLPPELLRPIFSHLPTSESEWCQSLRACALTCKAFVSPAQAYIFHTVGLSSESTARILLAKLESVPHIRTLVKRLPLGEIHRPWIQDSEALPDILRLLSPFVVSLDIHQRRRKHESPRFDFSSLSGLKYLEEILLREEDMRRPETTKYGDAALPSFLNHFPKLRAITLDAWVSNKTIDSKKPIAGPIFQLERLDVWCCCDALLLDWLTPALPMLRKLQFSYGAPSTYVINFIIKAGQSLQDLEIRGLGSQASNSVDLQALMTSVRTCASDLCSLNLVITGELPGHRPIQVVVQCLLHLGAHARLQHLTIEIFQYYCPVDGNPWDELQDLLVETRFPALRSVEFRVLLHSHSIPVPVEPYIAALPRLVKRGLLYVCHETRL